MRLILPGFMDPANIDLLMVRFPSPFPSCLCVYIILLAGLIDEGESAEQAAIRELKEETGYTATVKHVSPGILVLHIQ